MEPIFLKNTTLHERQMRFYNGHECPYCGNHCDLIDSKEVYQESHGFIYICRPCKAWVGVHHKNTDQSYGFVARKDLRDLRHKCHQLFDPLWGYKVAAGKSKKQAQASARKWLAEKLGIDVVECHIGMMDNDRCNQVIQICEEVYKHLEVRKAQKDNNAKWNVDAIYFLQLDLNHVYEVKEHKMNNLHILHLSDKNGFVLNVKPREQLYSTIGKPGKWKPFEDIEKLIDKYFKKQ